MDAVAAFATETVVGTFRLEVVVSGEFKNEGQLVSFRTTVRCPLRLPLSTATTAAAFAAFEHTLPPIEGMHQCDQWRIMNKEPNKYVLQINGSFLSQFIVVW